MKLLFLGTGAAEGVPGLWCACERCQAVRRERGRSVRRRTALCIDDRLLVDIGPDLVDSAARFDLDLAGIRTLLITHEHSDHLYLPNLEVRQTDFCPTPLPTLEVYGSRGAIALIEGMGIAEESMRLRSHVVAAFQTWQVDRYRVMALRARHAAPPLEPFFYALSDGSTSLLYAHDTGPFPDETWAALTTPPDGNRWAFDVVSIDATHGLDAASDPGHLNLAQVLEHRDRLAASGLLKPGARVFANHFSHISTPPHGALVERLAPTGVAPAYDGLTLVV